ncbi:MAG: twin arginine-targeting protein translocase TatC [Chloroflexi bacterium RBG_16_54_18]|nr:MAG: twin arginine-targeting protein translocase TatC [Chloroflexi bacterium RBG_16_54_18]
MRKFLRKLGSIILLPFRLVIWLLSIEDFIEVMKTEDTEDTALPEVVNKVVQQPSAVLAHLAELRDNLIRVVVILFLATGLSLSYNRWILDFLARPIGGMDELVAIDPTEPIGTVMRVALLTGFTVTFPYIFYQVWLFVAPAMIELRNRIRSLITIPIATAFFYAGMAFAYFVMLPTALPFLLNFMGIKTIPRPSSYIKFTTGMLFWIGIAFEFPIVIYFMATMGLVRAELLLSQWRLAIVIIAVISALITPTIDPVNMTLVMGPLIVLYFLSILLAKFAQIGRSRRLAAKT